MGQVVGDDRPLTLEDLTAWFAVGEKPASEWRVGAEHEKFVFRLDGHGTVAYDGDKGLHALLTRLQPSLAPGLMSASAAQPITQHGRPSNQATQNQQPSRQGVTAAAVTNMPIKQTRRFRAARLLHRAGNSLIASTHPYSLLYRDALGSSLTGCQSGPSGAARGEHTE